jgi:(R,R)-butanediol dehydrogenase / meso-butanediol dehydrogenase / diacetyl reductase
VKAAVMQGLHKPLIIETVPDPTPGAGDVIVKVGRCGICGSDLHMTEDPIYGAGKGTVLGHEFAGEVVAFGKEVENLAIGDFVAVIPLATCGHCAACKSGDLAGCDSFGLQGGGYAEFAVTRANQCIKLPQSASIADGAIIEPLAVALHGVNMSGLQKGDKVLILGAGPIGLAVAFWARRMGAAEIVILDIAAHQHDRALRMGATGFATSPDDPLINGTADIVFECVGVPGLIEKAVGQVRRRGTILLLGLCTRPDVFNSFAMLSKEVRLITSAFFSRQEYETALDALNAGAAEPRLLVTDTISLIETPARFEALRTRTHDCKVLIAP